MLVRMFSGDRGARAIELGLMTALVASAGVVAFLSVAFS